MRNKDIFSRKFKLPPLRTKDIQGRSQGVSSMSRDPLFVKVKPGTPFVFNYQQHANSFPPPPFFITLINYIRTYDSFRCHLKHIAIKIFRHIARCFPEIRKNIFWFLSLKQRANCPRLTLKKKVSERSKIDNITCCLNVRELMFREEKKFMEKSQRSRQKE